MPRTKQFEREKALETITELFWTKGYNGTSMDDLVQASGLSRSSLYDTFGSKYDLFRSALQHYQNKSKSTLEEQLMKLPSGREKIKAVLDFAVDQSLCDTKRKGCFMVNTTTELASTDNSIRKTAKDNLTNMEQLFTSLVEQAQQQGEVRKDLSASSLAHYLVNNFFGIRLLGQTNPDPKLLRDIADTTLKMI